ncbi:aryl-sulfate sulfotransferase [Flavobacteriales bacterium]|nr:aryl-sulfate sulfotransferase [Flavobacteriales bacterium]
MTSSSSFPLSPVLQFLFVWMVCGGDNLVMAQADNTVGVLLQSEASYDGFTLLVPTLSTSTFLINNCGEEVKSWTSTYRAGMMAYLLPNGDLVRAGRISNSSFPAGGIGGVVERFSWEGEREWSMILSNDSICQHHDVAVLPNGNILTLLWKSYNADQWVDRGRDPELTAHVVWGTYIAEIEPVGSNLGNIVWSWEAIDHLVQDFDDTKPNFGNPSDFPRKLDVNFAADGNDRDWLHTNSIAYHEELDHIMVSSRDFNELWIIDHQTSTAEAAAEAGDFLYRWGNPQAYGRGSEADQIFFQQHDARWGSEGNITVFSNGNFRPEGLYSTVEAITPPLETDGTYTLDSEASWGPNDVDWTYPSEPDLSFFSQNTSGAQPLANGNFLITEGASGELRELTPGFEKVWRYVNPIGTFGTTTQGASPIGNAVFKAERYSAAYPPLAGLDLPGQGLLESTMSAPVCELFPEPSCPPDFNGNYLVEVEDLLSFLSQFGCLEGCQGDLDGDQAVGIGDLLVLLSALGAPCPY